MSSLPPDTRHYVNGQPLFPPFPANTDQVLFGMGCFWGAERVFWQMPGVMVTAVGYAGGTTQHPSYEQVCSGRTGHAEVVEVIYDPSVITYDELLEVFWQTHDPTTLNRQGNDVGPQYRSVIFYHNDAQKQKAGHYKDALDRSGAWANPVVTAIEPFRNFYPAENYHQDYYRLNGQAPYCYYVIRPKLEKFEKVLSIN